ncbi:MAG: chemotaxis protein CheW [Chloroflexota bacterium]
MRLLVVRCGRYRLALPTGLVRGVVSAAEIVPLGLPELEGLMWREGALIPATRLDPLLGLPEAEDSMGGHGVLVHSDSGLLCFMVDEALDLVEVPDGSIVPLPPLLKRVLKVDGLESAALVDGILLILDPVRLLGPDGARALVAAAAMVGNPEPAGGGLE